eukprot:7187448-Prymnesium_polylepis.1
MPPCRTALRHVLLVPRRHAPCRHARSDRRPAVARPQRRSRRLTRPSTRCPSPSPLRRCAPHPTRRARAPHTAHHHQPVSSHAAVPLSRTRRDALVRLKPTLDPTRRPRCIVAGRKCAAAGETHVDARCALNHIRSSLARTRACVCRRASSSRSQ